MLPDNWGSIEDHAHAMGRLSEPEPPEPTIEINIDWPGECDHLSCHTWTEAFAHIGRFAHVLSSRIAVAVDDVTDAVLVDIIYIPNASEIRFHTGHNEFGDEREAHGWRR